MTNKLLAKEVNIVLAASADAVEKLGAPEKTTVVGNPVRPEVLTADRAAARAKLNAGKPHRDLSFGGSLGADRINQVVADLLRLGKADASERASPARHRQPRRQAV